MVQLKVVQVVFDEMTECAMPDAVERITWLLMDVYAMPLDQAVRQQDYGFLEFLVGPGEAHLGKGFPSEEVERALKAAMEIDDMRSFQLLLSCICPSMVRGEKLFTYASWLGNLTFLRWMGMNRPEWFSDDAMATAASSGRLEVVTFLVENELLPEVQDPLKAATQAAVAGCDNIVQFLVQHGCPIDNLPQLVETALLNGRLKLASWLEEVHAINKLRGHAREEEEQVVDEELVDAIDNVTWLAEHLDVCGSLTTTVAKCEISPLLLSEQLEREDVVSAIANKSAVDELQWLAEHFPMVFTNCHSKLLVQACQNGDCIKVDWLLKQSQSRSESILQQALDVACANGHLRIVQLLRDHGAPLTTIPMLDDAVKSGELALVKYLQDEGGVTHVENLEEAINFAACQGHTDMVEWFHSQRDKPYPKMAFYNASRAGNLSMLRLLLARRHHVKVLVQALKQGFLGGHPAVVKHLYLEIIKDRNAKVLRHAVWKALTDRKCYTRLKDKDCFGQMDALRFLLVQEETMAPMDSELKFSWVLLLAICKRDLRVIQLLQTKCAQAFSELSIQEAVQSGSLTILRFVHETRTSLAQLQEDQTDTAQEDVIPSGSVQEEETDAAQAPDGRQEEIDAVQAQDLQQDDDHAEEMDNDHDEETDDEPDEETDDESEEETDYEPDRDSNVAAMRGHVPMVEYLQNQNPQRTVSNLRICAMLGHWKVVRFVHQNHLADQNMRVPVALGEAIRCGELNVVQYLMSLEVDGFDVDDALCEACRYARLRVAQWLVENYGSILRREAYAHALQALIENRNDSLRQHPELRHLVALMCERAGEL